jgi:hypothetical protein
MDFAVRTAAETSAAFAFGDDSSDGLLGYYVLPYDEFFSFRNRQVNATTFGPFSSNPSLRIFCRSIRGGVQITLCGLHRNSRRF